MACGHGMHALVWKGAGRLGIGPQRAAPGLVRLAWRLDFLVRNLSEHCHMIRRTRTPSGHISGECYLFLPKQTTKALSLQPLRGLIWRLE